MKRNIFCFVLAMIMVSVLLAACGNSGNSGNSGNFTGATTQENHGSTNPPAVGEDEETNAEASAGLAYEELVKKAEEEGEVVVYGSFSPEVFDGRIKKGFEERYNIKVTYSRIESGTGGLSFRVDAEHKSGNVLVDVVNQGDRLIMEEFKKNGYLAKVDFLDPETGEASNDISDGYITPVNYSPIGIIYNSSKMEEPTSWEDLLDPSLEGEIGIADPEIKIAMIDLLVNLREHYGDEFIRKFGKQVVKYKDNPIVNNAVIGQEVTAGVNFSSLVLPRLENQSTMKYTEELGITSGPPQYQAVMANGPHPHAGLLFMNWCMSIEGQLAINGDGLGSSSLKGVEIEGVRPIPSGYNVADYQRALEEKDEILKLFNNE